MMHAPIATTLPPRVVGTGSLAGRKSDIEKTSIGEWMAKEQPAHTISVIGIQPGFVVSASKLLNLLGSTKVTRSCLTWVLKLWAKH
jgi:hypothetical protein